MIRIAQEAPAEAGAREDLLDRTMGSCRWLKPSERLRAGRAPAEGLSFVARSDGNLVGSVRLWHIAAGSAGAALLLGPLAVDPHYWGCGVGSALMTSAVTNAEARGHSAILLVGDAPYYDRFGFSSEHTVHLTMPAPVLRERFLGLELRPGALTRAYGMVVATGKPAMPSVVEAAELPLAA